MAAGFETWRDTVLKQIHFRPDRERIGRELADHYEDHRLDLERIGYPEDEAAERALSALGDPAEVGKALNREHSPLLGWLWLASRWLVGLALLMLLADVFILGGSVFEYRNLLPPQWPQKNTAEFPERFPELFPETSMPVGWTYLGGGTSESTVKADCYTLSVPQWSQWELPNGYARVFFVLTVEPEHLWQGGDSVEFTDDLCFCYAGGDAANIRNWRYALGGVPAPWVSIEHGSLAQGLTKECYGVEMALTEPAEWVEITYPYGDNDWVLRVELEGTP